MVEVGREQGGGVSEAVLKVAIYLMRELRASKIKIVHLQAKVVDTLVMDPSFFIGELQMDSPLKVNFIFQP